MKCKNCINYDGEYCEVMFDLETDDNLKPENVTYCKEFKAVMAKYRKVEKCQKSTNCSHI